VPDNKFVPGLIDVSVATYNKGIELRVSAYLQTRQEAVNGVSASLQAKKGKRLLDRFPFPCTQGRS